MRFTFLKKKLSPDFFYGSYFSQRQKSAKIRRVGKHVKSTLLAFYGVYYPELPEIYKSTQLSLKLLFALKSLDVTRAPNELDWVQNASQVAQSMLAASESNWYSRYGAHYYLLRRKSGSLHLSNFSAVGLFARLLSNFYCAESAVGLKRSQTSGTALTNRLSNSLEGLSVSKWLVDSSSYASWNYKPEVSAVGFLKVRSELLNLGFDFFKFKLSSENFFQVNRAIPDTRFFDNVAVTLYKSSDAFDGVFFSRNGAASALQFITQLCVIRPSRVTGHAYPFVLKRNSRAERLLYVLTPARLGYTFTNLAYLCFTRIFLFFGKLFCVSRFLFLLGKFTQARSLGLTASSFSAVFWPAYLTMFNLYWAVPRWGSYLAKSASIGAYTCRAFFLRLFRIFWQVKVLSLYAAQLVGYVFGPLTKLNIKSFRGKAYSKSLRINFACRPASTISTYFTGSFNARRFRILSFRRVIFNLLAFCEWIFDSFYLFRVATQVALGYRGKHKAIEGRQLLLKRLLFRAERFFSNVFANLARGFTLPLIARSLDSFSFAYASNPAHGRRLPTLLSSFESNRQIFFSDFGALAPVSVYSRFDCERLLNEKLLYSNLKIFLYSFFIYNVSDSAAYSFAAADKQSRFLIARAGSELSFSSSAFSRAALSGLERDLLTGLFGGSTQLVTRFLIYADYNLLGGISATQFFDKLRFRRFNQQNLAKYLSSLSLFLHSFAPKFIALSTFNRKFCQLNFFLLNAALRVSFDQFNGDLSCAPNSSFLKLRGGALSALNLARTSGTGSYTQFFLHYSVNSADASLGIFAKLSSGSIFRVFNRSQYQFFDNISTQLLKNEMTALHTTQRAELVSSNALPRLFFDNFTKLGFFNSFDAGYYFTSITCDSSLSLGSLFFCHSVSFGSANAMHVFQVNARWPENMLIERAVVFSWIGAELFHL